MHGKDESRLLGNGTFSVVFLRNYFVESYENIPSLWSAATRERKTRAAGCPRRHGLVSEGFQESLTLGAMKDPRIPW